MSRHGELSSEAKGATEKASPSGTGNASAAARAEDKNDPERLRKLMEGYQKADRAATTELVERLSPMLLRFLAGPVQTRPFAEDMLQDCWLRIHKARHSYREGTPVLPWVFAIARHTRIDSYRRRRRIDMRESSIEAKSEAFQPAAKPAAAPDLDLWRLVRQLPESQQEVIRMLKISGMTVEEVANATGTTVGAIKQKAHRAYEKLRNLLGDGGGVTR
ncbi:MAG: RNA polymerase sigma factor [Acidobacteria bacterium]|nr:RNA polymerase sigma factor [Acidobacteriota bacterium]